MPKLEAQEFQKEKTKKIKQEHQCENTLKFNGLSQFDAIAIRFIKTNEKNKSTLKKRTN